MTIGARYSGSYNWRTAPPAAPILGNTISNSQTIGVNGQLNFSTFYNKFPLLAKANQGKAPKPKKKAVDDDDVSAAPKKGDKKKEIELSGAGRFVLKFLTMAKQFQLDVNSTNGTTLPGYRRGINYLGMNHENQTPGFKFLAGFQDKNIRYDLARGGHLSENPLQISRFMQLNALELKGQGTIEPFDGFRILINFERRFSNTTSSVFRYDTNANNFFDESYMEAGAFNISTNTWRTAFEKYDKNFKSDAFNQFQQNRKIIASRVQEQELNSEVWRSRNYNDSIGIIDPLTRYPVGIDSNHQDVLMYSFLSAYQGKDAGSYKLDRFPLIPIPSWRITWSGLSNLELVKKLFTNITLSHSYSSNTSISNFSTSANYGIDTLQYGENLQPKYQFNSISIIERFSPLIKVDVTLKSGLTFNFELKTDRSLNLSTSFLINEIHNKEYVFGTGFRKSGVVLPFKINGRKPLLKNDLDFRFDFSIRDGYTITRNINAASYPPPSANAGMKSISIRPTLNYQITDNLNFRAFYNRNVNKPRTSQSFPTALTNFGISLRYTLQ